MKQIAIIAPTASGKTALSIEVAKKTNSIILSLDSLSVYKHIDIASAKPTLKKRDGILHFGIDEVYPNEKFDVMEFINLYKKAKKHALDNNQNLIIVGGTGFYLKSMINGISQVPDINSSTIKWVDKQLKDIKYIYKFLNNLDKKYMTNISVNDSYRIQKALLIYRQTNLIPSEFFKQNPPQPIIDNIDIYEIVWDIDTLRTRIKQRTKIIINDGLIDEVISLEKKYTRIIHPMNSIGISETLNYLDGKISKKQLENKISINTARLAKHQRTFNNSQFKNIKKASLEDCRKLLL
jgi:tRNA dimethylallyltransferase